MFGGGAEISFSAVEEAEIAEINRRVLRRKDPTISAILSQSNHVSVYGYESQIWEKQEIQGPLFLVQRNTVPPSFRIIILNKQNPVDFLLDFNLDTKLKCHDSILMLRSVVGPKSQEKQGKQPLPIEYVVDGIWFYDLTQQKTVYDTLCEIQTRLKRSTTGGAPRLPSPAPTPLQVVPAIRPEAVPDAAHRMSPAVPVAAPPSPAPPAYLASVLSSVLASQMPLIQSLPVSATQVREALLMLANDEGFTSRFAPSDPHQPPAWYRTS